LKKGIAVYRYDDRGIGKSEGKFRYNAYHNIEDLHNAFDNLRKIDSLSKKTIGILGHSIGGYAATVIDYQKELNIDFLILMATPVERNGEWFIHKFKKPKKKVSDEIIYKNILIPTLFIIGANDSRVNSTNSSRLLKKLGNKNIEINIVSGLNHFLIKGNDEWINTKDPNDLIGIYNIDKNALNKIISWTINQ